MARLAALGGMALGVGFGMVGTVFANKIGAPFLAGRLGASRGLGVLDDLAGDHSVVLALLRELELMSTAKGGARAKLFVKVKAALTAHALAEESVVYPLLRDAAKEEQLTRELFDEHARMKIIISEIERSGYDDPNFTASASRLRALVDEHARKEEERAFVALRQALGPDLAATLGSGVMREKVSFL